MQRDIVFGHIMMWMGSIASIPSGWFLCDGNNGTPDLRDKFIDGAGLGLSPGQIGGLAQHTHSFLGVGHSHSLQAGMDIFGGADFATSTFNTDSPGTTDPTDGVPPYYALAYIMFLGS